MKHTVADNWFKFLLILGAISILPGWFALLPLVFLLSLN